MPKSGLGLPASADVAEACFVVKRQMEVLQAENGLLRNFVEDLCREIVGGRTGGLELGKYREFERNGAKGESSDGRKIEKKTASDFNGFHGKLTEAEASEELKKALMGATAGA